MNDVRRGNVTGVYDVTRSGSSMFRGIKFDQCDDGTHALMPWEDYERLRKVVDAVERHYDAETTEPGGRESDRTLVEMFRAVDALREPEDLDE